MEALMSKEWIIAVLAVIAANVADILSPKAFLALGIAEAHSLWRKAQDKLGRWWGTPKMIIALGATAFAWWQDAILVPWIIAAGLAGVVVWNLWQIRKAMA